MSSLWDSVSDDGSCHDCPETPRLGLESAICGETANDFSEAWMPSYSLP